MRPNTPHCVLTPEAAICHGGHFYAMSTIQDTIFGVFHMFTLSSSITNTEHSHASRLLLRRLIIHIHHILVQGQSDSQPSELMAHLPDVSTLAGTLDLFLLCTFAELGELLDPGAYKKQHRVSKELETGRAIGIYTRGLAREVLELWFKKFIFVTPSSACPSDGKMVYQQFFAHKVQTLINYKKVAESEGIMSEEPSCTSVAFQSLAIKYFPCVSWPLPEDIPRDNFNWRMTGCRVKKIRQAVTEPRSGEPSFLYLYMFMLRSITRS